MQSAETQGDTRAFGHGTFLVAIKRIERIVVEPCFVRSAETGRLLQRKGWRAGPITCIQHRVILRISCARANKGAGVVGGRLPVNITTTRGKIPKEHERGWQTAAGYVAPGDRYFASILINRVARVAGVKRRRRAPAPIPVRVAKLVVTILEVG